MVSSSCSRVILARATSMSGTMPWAWIERPLGVKYRAVVSFSALVVVQRQHGLHRALAEAVGAHQYRALVILQGAGDDFRSRGAAAVDQHHQWYAFAGIGRVGVEAQLGVGDTPFGVDDQPAS